MMCFAPPSLHSFAHSFSHTLVPFHTHHLYDYFTGSRSRIWIFAFFSFSILHWDLSAGNADKVFLGLFFSIYTTRHTRRLDTIPTLLFFSFHSSFFFTYLHLLFYLLPSISIFFETGDASYHLIINGWFLCRTGPVQSEKPKGTHIALVLWPILGQLTGYGF